MIQVPHPSSVIKSQLVEKLRQYAGEAERLKQLHPAQLDIIYKQKWFNLFVPVEKGGLQLSLPEVLKLEESLAWIDGSLGWTVTLCAGAGWFIGFLDPSLTQELFTNEKVCLAGSGNASGTATIIPGGYEINGSWDYATGSFAATAFTANCIIYEEGKPLTDKNNEPLIRPFVFLKNEVAIYNNWQRIGMIATASQRFQVTHLKVNQQRAFTIDPEHAVLQHPVYQYPFLPLAETTLAVNTCGMAYRFFELCENMLPGNPERLQKLKGRFDDFKNCRAAFYAVTEASWEQCTQGENVNSGMLQKVSEASKQLAHTARTIVDEWYPYCGMQAADPATEINRVWRNIHTASQHRLLLI